MATGRVPDCCARAPSCSRRWASARRSRARDRPLRTTTAAGRLFAVLAEFERELIRERTWPGSRPRERRMSSRTTPSHARLSSTRFGVAPHPNRALPAPRRAGACSAWEVAQLMKADRTSSSPASSTRSRSSPPPAGRSTSAARGRRRTSTSRNGGASGQRTARRPPVQTVMIAVRATTPTHERVEYSCSRQRSP